MVLDYFFGVFLVIGIAIIWVAVPVISVRLGSRADPGMLMFRLGILRIVFLCGGCFVVAASFLVPGDGALPWEDREWLGRLLGAFLTVLVLLFLYAFTSGTLALAMYRRLYCSNHPEDADDPERPSVEAHIRRWRWLCRSIYRD